MQIHLMTRSLVSSPSVTMATFKFNYVNYGCMNSTSSTSLPVLIAVFGKSGIIN